MDSNLTHDRLFAKPSSHSALDQTCACQIPSGVQGICPESGRAVSLLPVTPRLERVGLESQLFPPSLVVHNAHKHLHKRSSTQHALNHGGVPNQPSSGENPGPSPSPGPLCKETWEPLASVQGTQLLCRTHSRRIQASKPGRDMCSAAAP